VGSRPLNGGVDLYILLGALLIGAGRRLLVRARSGKGGSAVSTPLLHALGRPPAIVAIASPLPATIPVDACSPGAATPGPGTVDRNGAAHRGDLWDPAHPRPGALMTRLDRRRAPLIVATDGILLVLGLRVLLGARTADEDGRALRSGSGLGRGPDDRRGSRSRRWSRDCSANSGGFLLAPLFMNVFAHARAGAHWGTVARRSRLCSRVPGTIVQPRGSATSTGRSHSRFGHRGRFPFATLWAGGHRAASAGTIVVTRVRARASCCCRAASSRSAR